MMQTALPQPRVLGAALEHILQRVHLVVMDVHDVDQVTTIMISRMQADHSTPRVLPPHALHAKQDKCNPLQVKLLA